MAKINDRPLATWAELPNEARFYVSDESQPSGQRDRNMTKAELAAALASAGGGEANTLRNDGGGAALAKAKDGTALPLRSLVAGQNVTITSQADTVTIAAAAAGGGGGLAVYGSGVDGDATISANTALTRDMYYNNLTVAAGVTLNTAGYRVFVRGTLTVHGTFERTPNHATATSGAGSLNSPLLGGSGNGGQGQATVGGAGGAQNNALGAAGGIGGAGASGAGGAAGAVTPPAANNGGAAIVQALPAALTGRDLGNVMLMGGAGGSGGGGDGTQSGGGGGSGGGVVVVAAQTVVGSGVVCAPGGNGGTRAFGNTGGGGGGGGGCLIVVTSQPPAPTLSAEGGLGAIGNGTGTAGQNGQPGRVVVLIN